MITPKITIRRTGYSFSCADVYLVYTDGQGYDCHTKCEKHPCGLLKILNKHGRCYSCKRGLNSAYCHILITLKENGYLSENEPALCCDCFAEREEKRILEEKSKYDKNKICDCF